MWHKEMYYSPEIQALHIKLNIKIIIIILRVRSVSQ